MAVERSFPASPVPLAGGKVLATPFQFYVTGEDKLVLVTWSSIVCTVAVEGRWWSADGGIEVFRHTFRTNGTTEAQSFSINVQPGFLLNCALDVLTPPTFPGQCFAQLLIGRGQGTTFVKLGIVLQGYIGTSKFLGFPGSPLEDSLSGTGYRERTQLAAVAAGVDWSVRPGTGKFWRVYLMTGFLQTSAVVITRYVAVQFLINGIALRGRVAAPYAQTASQGVTYTWGPGMTVDSVDPTVASGAALPNPCYLEPLTDFQAFTHFLQAGDQWTTTVVQYEEWLVTDTTPAFIL